MQKIGRSAWMEKRKPGVGPLDAVSVSYTHLTLPTKA